MSDLFNQSLFQDDCEIDLFQNQFEDLSFPNLVEDSEAVKFPSSTEILAKKAKIEKQEEQSFPKFNFDEVEPFGKLEPTQSSLNFEQYPSLLDNLDLN